MEEEQASISCINKKCSYDKCIIIDDIEVDVIKCNTFRYTNILHEEYQNIFIKYNQSNKLPFCQECIKYIIVIRDYSKLYQKQSTEIIRNPLFLLKYE